MARGRPIIEYDAQKAQKVVDLIEAGKTTEAIFRKRMIPGLRPRTWYRWRREHPELEKAVQEARTRSAELLEEEALTRTRGFVDSSVDATNERLRALSLHLDQLRWSASRRNPGQFGESTRVQVKVPVQIITSLNLGQLGGSDAPPPENIYDLQAVRIEDEPAPAEALPTTELKPVLDFRPRKRVLTPRIPMDAETPRASKDVKRAYRVNGVRNASKPTIPRRGQEPVQGQGEAQGQGPGQGEQDG